MRRIWISKSGAALAIALVLSAVVFACGGETIVEVTREVQVTVEVEKEVQVEVEKQVTVEVQKEVQVEVTREVEVEVVVTATAEAYGAGAGAETLAAATAVVEAPTAQSGKLVVVSPDIGAGWFTSSPYDDYTSDNIGVADAIIFADPAPIPQRGAFNPAISIANGWKVAEMGGQSSSTSAMASNSITVGVS